MKHPRPAASILTTTDAAHLLQLSPSRVRQLVDAGVLPANRTPGGMRLIPLAAVEALAEQRTRLRTEAEARDAGA